VGEMASGRTGERANLRKGVAAWCHIAGWSIGLTVMASDECVCAWGLTPSSRRD
jgi:hypothetical protein